MAIMRYRSRVSRASTFSAQCTADIGEKLGSHPQKSIKSAFVGEKYSERYERSRTCGENGAEVNEKSGKHVGSNCQGGGEVPGLGGGAGRGPASALGAKDLKGKPSAQQGESKNL